MNLQELNQIKNQVIEKAEKPFEKGRGKNAEIGERREHSGNVYIKTATGWVYQSKSGKHMHYENATKKSVPATQEHIDLHTKHIGSDAIKPSQSAKPASTAAVEPKQNSLPKIGSSVYLKITSDLPLSLRSHVGYDLKVVGYENGTISVPKFLTVEDKKGEKHSINPDYVTEVKFGGIKESAKVEDKKEQPKVEDKPKEKVGENIIENTTNNPYIDIINTDIKKWDSIKDEKDYNNWKKIYQN